VALAGVTVTLVGAGATAGTGGTGAGTAAGAGTGGVEAGAGACAARKAGMATMTARRVHIVSFPFIFIVFIVNALSGESVVLRFLSGLECAPNTASVRPIAGYLDEIVEEWRRNRCTVLHRMAQSFRETLHKSQPRALLG
jgi:hypothetical protein